LVPASIPAPVTGRDDEFYLTDEMTVFQVENLLFRVPQCIFSLNSLIFSSMFSLPHGDGGVEGRSDAEPIHLSSITVLEFETLLQYLFRGMNDNFKLPQSRWIALLSIAHRFEFQNVFERAMREIFDRPESEREESDDPHLIKVAEKYDVPFEYVLPTLVALVMREEPLTELEVSLLSPLTVSRLGRAREDFLCKTVGRPSSFSGPGGFGPTAYGGPGTYGGGTHGGGTYGGGNYGGGIYGGGTYGGYGSHNTNAFGGPMTSDNPRTVAMEIVRGIWLPPRNSD